MNKLIKITITTAIAFIFSLGISNSVKAQKYGNDSVQCITSISLYTEFYKQENFNEAYPYWNYVFHNCPAASQNTYINGVRIVYDKIGKAKTLEERNLWVDTLMMVYNKRIEHFGSFNSSREGMVRGRQAMELMNLRPNDSATIYKYLRMSVKMEGDKVDPNIASNYFIYVDNMVNSKVFDADSMINAYDELSELAERKIAQAAEIEADPTDWKNVKALVESRFEPFATCEQLINIYTKKFAQTPDDTTLLKKITFMLDRKDCTDSELFLKATEKLHQLTPNPTSAYLMAKLMIRENNFAKAETYFLEALPGLNNDLQEKTYFSLALLKFDQKNYSAARNYLNKAIGVNPNNGKYYIVIGDMYAASASSCGDDEISSRAGYWAAVDKYIKARSVDPSVADEANRKIGTYSSYFPTKERLFFHEISEGTPYRVGCWIGESTTVRASR